MAEWFRGWFPAKREGGKVGRKLLRGHDPHTRSFMCIHVFEGSRPVLYVCRPEGDWCFFCGEGHPQEAEQYPVVGLVHAVEADSTVAEVLDLEPDEEAERDHVGGPWKRGPLTDL